MRGAPSRERLQRAERMELKMQQERERRQRKIPPSAGPNDEYALRLSQLRKAMSKPEEPNG
jgi:hypothetical protein